MIFQAAELSTLQIPRILNKFSLWILGTVSESPVGPKTPSGSQLNSTISLPIPAEHSLAAENFGYESLNKYAGSAINFLLASVDEARFSVVSKTFLLLCLGTVSLRKQRKAFNQKAFTRFLNT